MNPVKKNEIVKISKDNHRHRIEVGFSFMEGSSFAASTLGRTSDWLGALLIGHHQRRFAVTVRSKTDIQGTVAQLPAPALPWILRPTAAPPSAATTSSSAVERMNFASGCFANSSTLAGLYSAIIRRRATVLICSSMNCSTLFAKASD